MVGLFVKLVELILEQLSKIIADKLIYKSIFFFHIKTLADKLNYKNTKENNTMSIKEFLYDIQREKSFQKQTKLIQSYVDNKMLDLLAAKQDAHAYIQELEENLKTLNSDYLELADLDFIYVISSKNYSVSFEDQDIAIRWADDRFRTQAKHDISFDEKWLHISDKTDCNENDILLERNYYSIISGSKNDKTTNIFRIGGIKRTRLYW